VAQNKKKASAQNDLCGAHEKKASTRMLGCMLQTETQNFSIAGHGRMASLEWRASNGM
jgi:hypothetical protein